MILINELQYRGLHGPIIRERDFDLKLAERTRALVSDLDIKMRPDEVIPEDDVADKVFLAGITLLNEIGLYLLDTNRKIQIDISEIQETVNSRPNKIFFGEGKDQVIFEHRGLESPVPAVICGGSSGCPISEDVYAQVMESHAQEVLAKGIYAGSLVRTGHVTTKVGTPTELEAVTKEATILRSVARKVGKPGMYIGIPMSALSPASIFAAYFEGGYTPNNSQLPIHIFPELKLNWDRILLAAYSLQAGIIPWNSYGAILGSFSRNAEEAAVITVAGQIGELVYGNGSCCSISPRDIRGRGGTKEILRATTLASLAIGRNMKIPYTNAVRGIAGPCTDVLLYEIAAGTMAYVVTGASWLWCALGSNGIGINYTTGMETRFMGEVSLAAVELTRQQANEIINKVFDQIGNRQDPKIAPKGLSFLECYDLAKLQPKQQYLDLAHQVKDQLSSFGLNFKY